MSEGYQWERCSILCKEVVKILDGLLEKAPMPEYLRDSLKHERNGVSILGRVTGCRARCFMSEDREGRNV